MRVKLVLNMPSASTISSYKSPQQLVFNAVPATNIQEPSRRLAFEDGDVPLQTGDDGNHDYILELKNVGGNASRAHNYLIDNENLNKILEGAFKNSDLLNKLRQQFQGPARLEARQLNPKPLPSLYTYHDEEDDPCASLRRQPPGQSNKILSTLEVINKTGKLKVELRYCTACHIEQPLRSKHCR